MAAQIVLEQAVGWQGGNLIDLMLEKPGILGGQGVPGGSHGGDIVEHMALRVLRAAHDRTSG